MWRPQKTTYNTTTEPRTLRWRLTSSRWEQGIQEGSPQEPEPRLPYTLKNPLLQLQDPTTNLSRGRAEAKAFLFQRSPNRGRPRTPLSCNSRDSYNSWNTGRRKQDKQDGTGRGPGEGLPQDGEDAAHLPRTPTAEAWPLPLMTSLNSAMTGIEWQSTIFHTSTTVTVKGLIRHFS